MAATERASEGTSNQRRAVSREFIQLLAGSTLRFYNSIRIQKEQVYVGKRRDMPVHDNHDVRREATHNATHLPHLTDIDDDRGDADNVIVARGELLLKALSGGEIEHRAGRRDVPLDHHDPPGAVKHPE